MAHIVVLGAGLGGVMMAYEMQDQLGRGDRLTVVTKGTSYSFVPSNPWVAVGWRDRDDIEVDDRHRRLEVLEAVMQDAFGPDLYLGSGEPFEIGDNAALAQHLLLREKHGLEVREAAFVPCTRDLIGRFAGGQGFAAI